MFRKTVLAAFAALISFSTTVTIPVAAHADGFSFQWQNGGNDEEYWRRHHRHGDWDRQQQFEQNQPYYRQQQWQREQWQRDNSWNRPNYEQRRQQWDRPLWDREPSYDEPPVYVRPRGICRPGEALGIAADYGLRRARIVEQSSRRVMVQGMGPNGWTTIQFANMPGCPILR